MAVRDRIAVIYNIQCELFNRKTSRGIIYKKFIHEFRCVHYTELKKFNMFGSIIILVNKTYQQKDYLTV